MKHYTVTLEIIIIHKSKHKRNFGAKGQMFFKGFHRGRCNYKISPRVLSLLMAYIDLSTGVETAKSRFHRCFKRPQRQCYGLFITKKKNVGGTGQAFSSCFTLTETNELSTPVSITAVNMFCFELGRHDRVFLICCPSSP